MLRLGEAVSHTQLLGHTPAKEPAKADQKTEEGIRAVLKRLQDATDQKQAASSEPKSLKQAVIDLRDEYRQHNQKSYQTYKTAVIAIKTLHKSHEVPIDKKVDLFSKLFAIAIQNASAITDPKTRFKSLLMLSRFAVLSGEVEQARTIYQFATKHFEEQTKKMSQKDRSEIEENMWSAYLELTEAENAIPQFTQVIRDMKEMASRTDVTPAQKKTNYKVMLKEAEQYISKAPRTHKKIYLLAQLAIMAERVGEKEFAREKFAQAVRAFEVNIVSFPQEIRTQLVENLKSTNEYFEKKTPGDFASMMKDAIQAHKSGNQEAAKSLLKEASLQAMRSGTSKQRIKLQIMVGRYAMKMEFKEFAIDTYAKVKADVEKCGHLNETDKNELRVKALELYQVITA